MVGYGGALAWAMCAACSPTIVPSGAGDEGGSSSTTGGPVAAGSSVGTSGLEEGAADADTETDTDPQTVVARLVYTSERGVLAHDVRASGEIVPEEVILPGVWISPRARARGLLSVASRSSLDWKSREPISHAIFDPFGAHAALAVVACPPPDDCSLFEVGGVWGLSSNPYEANWGTIHTFTLEDDGPTELQLYEPDVLGGPDLFTDDYVVLRTQEAMYRATVPEGSTELLIEFTSEAEQWRRVSGTVVEVITEGTPETGNQRSLIEFVDVAQTPLEVHEIRPQPGKDDVADWLNTSHGVLTVEGPGQDVFWSRWEGSVLGPAVQVTQGELEGRATAIVAHGIHVSVDGDWLAFGAKTHGGLGDVYLVSTQALDEPLRIGEQERHPYFSADGRYLYFMSYDSAGGYTASRVELQPGGTVGAQEVVAAMPGRTYRFSDDGSSLVVDGGIADVRTSPPTITEVDACADSPRFISPDGLIVSCDADDTAESPRPVLVHRATGQVVEQLGGAAGVHYVPVPE